MDPYQFLQYTCTCLEQMFSAYLQGDGRAQQRLQTEFLQARQQLEQTYDWSTIQSYGRSGRSHPGLVTDRAIMYQTWYFLFEQLSQQKFNEPAELLRCLPRARAVLKWHNRSAGLVHKYPRAFKPRTQAQPTPQICNQDGQSSQLISLSQWVLV